MSDSSPCPQAAGTESIESPSKYIEPSQSMALPKKQPMNVINANNNISNATDHVSTQTGWIVSLIDRADLWGRTNPTLAGVVFGLISSVTLSVHVVGLRALPTGKNPYQITHIEAVFSLLYSLGLNWVSKGEHVYSKDYSRVSLFLFRALFAMPGYTSNVIGTYLLPSQLFIVLNNSNLIFAILIAAAILRVYPPPTTWLFVSTFLLGVLIMVYPEALGLADPKQSHTDKQDYQLWWIFFPIMSGFTGGSVTNLLQIYSGGITLFQNSFWWSLSIILGTGIIFPLVSDQYEALGFSEYLLLPFLGSMIFSSLVTYNLSCRYEKRAAVVTSISCSQIVMTYILDVIFSGSPLMLLNVIGASIVILSIVGIAWFKHSK